MKTLRIFAMLVIVATMALSGCSKAKNELTKLAQEENALLPHEIGRLTITKVDFDGEAYNYYVDVPSKYFNLKDSTDLDVLERLFKTYIAINKDAKPNKRGAKGLFSDGVQATGLGLDVATASDGIPIRYLLCVDGSDTPAHVVEITFNSREDLLGAFFGPMPLEELNLLAGGIGYMKDAEGKPLIVVSPNYYRLGENGDIKEMKRAIAKKEMSSLSPEDSTQLANLTNAAMLDEVIISSVCNVYDFMRDSINAPKHPVNMTLREIRDKSRN